MLSIHVLTGHNLGFPGSLLPSAATTTAWLGTASDWYLPFVRRADVAPTPPNAATPTHCARSTRSQRTASAATAAFYMSVSVPDASADNSSRSQTASGTSGPPNDTMLVLSPNTHTPT